MLKLKLCYLLAFFSVVLGDDFADKKKFFHFIRVQRGSNDFNFEYVTDNGEQVNGRAIAVSPEEPSLYIMQGQDAPFYWVKFTENELKNEDDFDKIVRSVKLNSNGNVVAQLKDDFVLYEIRSNGQLSGGKYEPDWNLDNIGFELADTLSKTFYYVISSKNNGREFRGTTSYVNDPHVQTVSLPDQHECILYQTTFTDNELSSVGETIYKNVQKSFQCNPPQLSVTPAAPKQLDARLLQSLVRRQMG